MYYTYKAIDERGKTVTGEIEADSELLAGRILSNRGYIPTGLIKTEKSKRDRSSGLSMGLASVKHSELILLTKQLKTMLSAGISILRALEILESQTENKKLRRVVGALSEDIKEGATLHESFSKHPGVFPPLYCSMLQAGEISGALPEVLERLTLIMEHEHTVKSDIKAALQYPVIVLSFLGVAFFILLMFVIPKFVGIFSRTGLTLPLPTRVCIMLYNLIMEFWLPGMGILIAAGISLFMFLRTEPGRFMKDSLLMALPVIGPLFRKAAMSRFASIFAILQTSGVNILDSMKILAETLGNAAITRDFNAISRQLTEGRGIAEPLKSSRYFPPMVINMGAIGEESGNLDEMLHEVSSHYDTEVKYSMKALSEAIGPVLTVGLACLVGFFALAIFLPMWDMTKMVK